jgi:hypothetical protein
MTSDHIWWIWWLQFWLISYIKTWHGNPGIVGTVCLNLHIWDAEVDTYDIELRGREQTCKGQCFKGKTRSPSCIIYRLYPQSRYEPPSNVHFLQLNPNLVPLKSQGLRVEPPHVFTSKTFHCRSFIRHLPVQLTGFPEILVGWKIQQRGWRSTKWLKPNPEIWTWIR